ncbi:ribonuclease E activity regulator RraA [Geobacillus icigianus]|uniref:4-hydroxy-4-methyl-2-oxoglutarate aldolase n=1 Tax=Geobacillus icigianus TaxID=1430331 RepID=A0ABU6BI77_9BACL|nr:ribonuclease E activity regulator RraA [Geobacillus icigianus]MEB3751671.1 putative 4-hydroxy-4-methyl-2-oxoglutarate aldolase [Geobacillus icigianus]
MKTADLCDQFLDELQVCEVPFQSYGGKQMFSGPIATVDVLEDNVLVREALETVPAGTVLVVDGKGSRRVALFGDRLAQIACERGLAGVIIHGCIRDSAEIGAMPIGVMAIGTCPVKSRKEGKGARDVALEFGGVRWEPGAYVYADADGIVVARADLSAKNG